MATSANSALGAISANGSGSDPFVSTPPHAHPSAVRYGAFDNEQISAYSTNSPTQTRRALEAHLKDTERRIQDASKLGVTLVQQRKSLASRLRELEEVEKENEVPADLRQRLTELEKEYNEVGKESARAFLPKLRSSASEGLGPSVLSAQGGVSPSKVSAPSRRQRNQSDNRVHDIEFATEISTSLLAQVRQLQAALAEKDQAHKDILSEKSQVEAEAVNMAMRIKQMDESSQRYKDDNWNLETKLQDLETHLRETQDKEQRLNQSLKITQSEKAAAQRDLDDLKVSHEKLYDDHATARRQQETDLHTWRRDAASHETEKSTLQKKVDELTAQNTELAKAVSYRWNRPNEATAVPVVSDKSDDDFDDADVDPTEPASPVKGTPARAGMLESETLKSSLNHAHRMIQNLKNNIHREKTEKVELKRMLNEARDELERSRGEGPAGANVSKKRRSEPDGVKFRRPAKPNGLGATRGSTTEFLEDEPEWEDHDGQTTPSKSRFAGAAIAGAVGGAAASAALAHHHEAESSDAFETADERHGDTTTETEAFQTGVESMDDESDELTETESNAQPTSLSRRRITPLVLAKPGERRSYMSTASTSADEEEQDEDDMIRTPVQSQIPKYRLRLGRGGRRSGRASDFFADSPASSEGTPKNAGMSLGDELDALDDESNEGTPDRYLASNTATPETQRYASVGPETPAKSDGGDVDTARGDEDVSASQLEPEIGSPAQSGQSPKPVGDSAVLAHQANAAMLAHEFAITKPTMVDAGIMTEPWQPEKEIVIQQVPAEAGATANEDEKKGFAEKAGGIVGGALAGFGIGRFSKDRSDSQDQPITNNETAIEAPVTENVEDATTEPKSLAEASTMSQEDGMADAPSVQLQHSSILMQETEPIAPLVLVEPMTPSRPTTAKQIDETPMTLPTGRNVVQDDIPRSAVEAIPEHEAQELGFSGYVAQDYEPVEPEVDEKDSQLHTPILPRRSSRRGDAGYISDNDHPAPAGATAATDEDTTTLYEPKVYGGGRGTGNIPTLVFGDSTEDLSSTQFSSEPKGERTVSTGNEVPVTKPLQIKKQMADEGSQTAVSGHDIDNLMRNKSTISAGSAAAGLGAAALAGGVIGHNVNGAGQRRSMDGAVGHNTESNTIRTPRRPTSSSSMRSKNAIIAPPLPADHTQKIAAAAQKVPTTPAVSATSMGPPTMPASAYKQYKHKTPSDRMPGRSTSRDGTTPRPTRAPARDAPSPAGISRRGSVSSFASELDERFNIHRGNVILPADGDTSADPRMIQAITQTMIGEYLWKYTRKAGRSETSNSRHRRFFWVHPYTRTLYWSEHDPSTAGKDMMKAKSVAIEAVRVITDENTNPPGLHRKSLVVVTPGREIVFTAPTGQRHETWFNALSYLLLRTGQEKSEAEDVINEDDLEDFDPSTAGFSIRRSISRMTGRSQSRQSLSSYNSRTTRASSPRRAAEGNTMAQRQAAAAQRASTLRSPTPNEAQLGGSMSSRNRGDASRMSSFTSRFKAPSSTRGSFSSSKQDRSSMSLRGKVASEDGDIYNASVVGDSAEDLRQVIERQEKEADRLENVRACCDGKHDVGSLSRSGRPGLKGRFSSSYHTHSHPRAETMTGSMSSRT